MAALTFADSHNMVAYLEKSEANADFAEIVDFLNASPINYALTVSPTIYVSYIEQFWSTAKTKTVNNETQIRAKVDDEVVHEERGDTVERVATTAASLDAEQDSGNINRTQSTAIHNVPFPQGIGSGGSPRCQEAMGDTIAQTRSERVSTPSYDSPLLGVNTPGSDEERIELKELMDMYTKLSDKVLDLENPRAESSKESLGEKDASKQGRNSDKTQELNVAKDEHMFELSNLAGTEVIADQEETTERITTAVDDSVAYDVTLVETLMAIRSSSSKPQKLKGVVFKEPSEPTTTSRRQPHIPVKDKGKGIMQEPEKPVKVKGKDQIEYDADSMEGYKHKDFKGKSFDAIKKMFDKAYKRVNTFVAMDSEVVESSRKKDESSGKEAVSKKRVGEKVSEESVKREKAELKLCLEIAPNDDKAINIEPLVIKSPIVDCEKQILGEELFYYQIKRADGNSKVYKVLYAMLNDFDRQDLIDLYRLVKKRFKTT
ncbi:hypothetical protein Tco_0898145 [Tanacetum coccineum]